MVMAKSQKSKRARSRSSYHMIVQPHIVLVKMLASTSNSVEDLLERAWSHETYLQCVLHSGQAPQSFQQVNEDRLTSEITMALMRQVDISSNPAVPFQRLVKLFALHRKGFWVVVGVTVNVKQWRFETVGVHIRRISPYTHPGFAGGLLLTLESKRCQRSIVCARLRNSTTEQIGCMG
jgi:hypothetical protein